MVVSEPSAKLICYSERLGEFSAEPSVGSIGDACDNALAIRSLACTRPD
jgi:hypothetical protein